MTNDAVRVDDLSKVFRIWRRPSDMFMQAVTGRQRHKDFMALRGVSFSVKKGSVFGILGRNGSGKSTLLRIVAGTLDASGGHVAVNGRVAAILELGTGFHPEYSGRDNIYLGGMCLGLSREEIDQRFDAIVEFAELQEFIDQPFRTYSSGMQARLTFSVATAVDPDVLIIDEALSVGDARFALKSFDRIRDFARRGKSILFVSHDIVQVMSFCDEALLLEKGEVFAQGKPQKVGNIYHELLFGDSSPLPGAGQKPALAAEDEPLADAPPAPQAPPVPEAYEPVGAEPVFLPTNSREHRYGDKAVEITRFYLVDAEGLRVSHLTSLQNYELVARLQAHREVRDVGIGILIRTPMGIQVFGANSHILKTPVVRDMRRGESLTVRMPFRANLGHGTYFLSVVASRSDALKHDAWFDCLQFDVEHTVCHSESLTNIDISFHFLRDAVPAAGE